MTDENKNLNGITSIYEIPKIVVVPLGNMGNNSEMYFSISNGWIMKLNNEGIYFNRELFTDHSPDDFAREVIAILERNFNVKFEKRNPPEKKVNCDMKEKIDDFIKYFTTITKREADYIDSVLNWDSETKVAFRLAKRIFEEKKEKE